MAIALLLTACGKDDDGGGEENTPTPINFTANIQSETISRVTVNNNWGRLSDSRIAIMIGGVTKEYAVNENGEITSDDPFYWEGQKDITVESWYPYCDGVKPETLVVYADQSIQENYEKSDYLEVVNGGVTLKKNVLTFTHRTTKMFCNVSSEYGDPGKAQVFLHELAGVNEGTSVTMNKAHCALIVPQTIPVGTEFLEIHFEDGSKRVYTLEEELDLKKGFQTKADITITPDGIEVVFSEISSWIADTETPGWQSPGANPGNNGDGWTGDSEDTSGNSSEANPDNGSGSWTGNSEDTTGSSSEANPDNGNNGNWTEDDEDANGNSPDANPNNGNGNWSESPEDAEDADADGTAPDDWGWTTTP